MSSSDESSWKTGTLKWFSLPPGYGFIEFEEGDALVYAHTLRAFGFKNLPAGSRVLFRCARRSKGLVVTELAPVGGRDGNQ